MFGSVWVSTGWIRGLGDTVSVASYSTWEDGWSTSVREPKAWSGCVRMCSMNSILQPPHAASASVPLAVSGQRPANSLKTRTHKQDPWDDTSCLCGWSREEQSVIRHIKLCFSLKTHWTGLAVFAVVWMFSDRQETRERDAVDLCCHHHFDYQDICS